MVWVDSNLGPGDGSMASRWYFTRNGKDRLGPFTSKQLWQLAVLEQLLPTDMVFLEGGRKWVQANKVKGLFPPVNTSSASVPDCPTAIPKDQSTSLPIADPVVVPGGTTAVTHSRRRKVAGRTHLILRESLEDSQ